jgi:hypothetical protein
MRQDAKDGSEYTINAVIKKIYALDKKAAPDLLATSPTEPGLQQSNSETAKAAARPAFKS